VEQGFSPAVKRYATLAASAAEGYTAEQNQPQQLKAAIVCRSFQQA